MQSIITKYLGNSITKPARVKAWASGGGGSLTQSVEMYPNEDAHLAVARALATKLKWSGRWIEGHAPKGWGMLYVIDTGRGFTIDKEKPKKAEYDPTCALCETGEEPGHEH